MIFSEKIAESLLGSLLALLLAGLVWIIKAAHEKHKKTSLAVCKLERSLIENNEFLKESLSLTDQWIDVVKNNGRFVAAPFSSPIIDNENLLYLGDMNLVNVLFRLNIQQKRLSEDLSGLRLDYRERISYLIDGKMNEAQWRSYNLEMVRVLTKMRPEILQIQSDVIYGIAYLQLHGRVRYHSLFNYIHLLGMDIFPRVTEKKIRKKASGLLGSSLPETPKG